MSFVNVKLTSILFFVGCYTGEIRNIETVGTIGIIT